MNGGGDSDVDLDISKVVRLEGDRTKSGRSIPVEVCLQSHVGQYKGVDGRVRVEYFEVGNFLSEISKGVSVDIICGKHLGTESPFHELIAVSGFETISKTECVSL